MQSNFTRRRFAVAVLLASTVLGAAACGDSGSEDVAGSTTSTAATTEGPKVVASTTWVGAIAKLAGATDITVVAPSSAQHPPDYDPKASDLAAIADADYVLVAGFEGFADRMKEAAGSDAKVLTVEPDYAPEKVAAAATALAKEWGTTETADANVADYTEHYEEDSAALKATTSSSPQTVVAHLFMAGWGEFAGYEVAGTYGPEPTSAAKVAELAALKPTLVFENSHMGGGAEVASAAGAKLVQLVNFPGDDLDLVPVLDINAERITEAIGG